MALALEEWNKAIADVNLLQNQITINEALARKLQEEVAALSKFKDAVKRVRIVSICTFGAGLATWGISNIPGIDEDLKKILGASGIGLMGAGGLTFGVSVTIPFN